jgi:hypothetical protein
MRTTITLDEDVGKKLDDEVRRQKGASFKDVVNEMLRIGLLTKRELKGAEPFKVEARPMGVRPGLNYDNIGDLIEHLEGASHK